MTRDLAPPDRSFRDALASTDLVVVGELRPPDGADLDSMIADADELADRVSCIQLTDMPRATPHLDNLAATALLAERGFDVMVTMTCRDRNLIAQQARLLAAAALGASSAFCITGDPVSVGDHPSAREVFELRALDWLQLARRMRDMGQYASGRAASPAPDLLLGAALAPDGPREPVEDSRAKVAAGADFFMTQPIFEPARLASLLADMAGIGVVPDCGVVAGIAAPPSLERARWLDAFPGINVPEGLLARMEAVGPERQRALALDDVATTIDALRAMDHVAGVLVYPVGDDVGWMVQVLDVIRGTA
jgi:5,10-methylenetetrahydrofolate reductase